MGLDMYLYRKTYVKNWEFMSAEQRHTITISGPAASYIDPEKISEIVEQVAYWRKANAIHAWFVHNVQGGRDECQESYVSREQLIALRDLCLTVLDDPRKATSLLPTQSGFFFGSTDYDESYFGDLKETVRMLSQLDLSPSLDGDLHVGDLYYRASW